MQTILDKKMYTKAETAELLSVNERFVSKEIKGGNLRAVTIGKQIYISEDSLRDYLDGKKA